MNRGAVAAAAAAAAAAAGGASGYFKLVQLIIMWGEVFAPLLLNLGHFYNTYNPGIELNKKGK